MTALAVLAFGVGASAKRASGARLTRKIQLHVSDITTTSATLEAVFNVEAEYAFSLTRLCSHPKGGKCQERAVAAGHSTPGETVRVEVDDLAPDSAYFFRVKAGQEVTKVVKKFHTKPESRMVSAGRRL